MIRMVLDTNVIVSALMNPHGVPGGGWARALSGDVQLCVDGRMLNEYYDVLGRKDLGLDQGDVNDVLAFINDFADVVVAPPSAVRTADEGDQCFIDVTLAAKADCLVTGNVRHFSGLSKAKVRVLTPRQFLDGFVHS